MDYLVYYGAILTAVFPSEAIDDSLRKEERAFPY